MQSQNSVQNFKPFFFSKGLWWKVLSSVWAGLKRSIFIFVIFLSFLRGHCATVFQSVSCPDWNSVNCWVQDFDSDSQRSNFLVCVCVCVYLCVFSSLKLPSSSSSLLSSLCNCFFIWHFNKQYSSLYNIFFIHIVKVVNVTLLIYPYCPTLFHPCGQ